MLVRPNFISPQDFYLFYKYNRYKSFMQTAFWVVSGQKTIWNSNADSEKSPY